MDNSSDYRDIFCERLKELLKKNGLTISKFCELANVPKGNFSKYMSKLRSINVKYLIITADFFNVSIDYLLGRTEITEISIKEK